MCFFYVIKCDFYISKLINLLFICSYLSDRSRPHVLLFAGLEFTAEGGDPVEKQAKKIRVLKYVLKYNHIDIDVKILHVQFS